MMIQTFISILFLLQINPFGSPETPEKARQTRQILEQRQSQGLIERDSALIGGLECETSYLICDFTDKTFSLPTTGPGPFPNPTLCFGVGVPHNMSWFAFMTRDSVPMTLTFGFTPADCETGQGIQGGVFENCAGSVVWDCNASCNTSTFALSGWAVAGQVYYLWIDGCNGDICETEIEISQNVELVCELPEPIPAPVLEGVDLCYVQDLSILPPFDYPFIHYEWTINGMKYTTVGGEALDLPRTMADSLEIELISLLKSQINGGMVLDSDTSFFKILNHTDANNSRISGRIQGNFNGNCQLDGSEWGLPYTSLEIKNNNAYVLTTSDSNGDYLACLPAGEYSSEIQADFTRFGAVECFEDSVLTLSNSMETQFDPLINWSEYCWSPKLMIHRPNRDQMIRCNGQDGEFDFTITNYSFFTLPAGSVIISIDTFLEITGVEGLGFDQLTPMSVEVYHPELPPLESVTGTLKVTSDCDTSDLGERYCILVEFMNENTLCEAAEMESFCLELRAAYDPNFLEAHRTGETNLHYIEDEEVIDYAIHFENEGNDTAYDVHLRHKFDHPINLETFELINASHPQYSVVIDPNDPMAIDIFFPNILLNYKAQDSTESKGYIRYKVAMESLPKFERFESYADIVFDFNPAIRTNTVFHTITTDYLIDTMSVSICQGETWNGMMIERDTMIFDTIVIPGPDQLNITSVFVHPVYDIVELDTVLCEGVSMEWRGTLIDESGTYTHALLSSKGCDSNRIAMVEFVPSTFEVIDTTVQAGTEIQGVMVNQDTSFTVQKSGAPECLQITYNVMVIMTSTHDLPKGTIQIKPNPFTNELTLDVLDPDWRDVTVRVLSVNGELLWSKSGLSEHEVFETGHWAKGLYLLEVRKADDTWVQKLVKM